MRTLFIYSVLLLSNVWAAGDDAISHSYQLEAAGKYEEAVGVVEALAQQQPKEYYFALRAGWLTYLAGHYTRSLQHYKDALLLKPDSLEARLGQITPYLALGKYEQAGMAAQVVLRSDPKNYTARIKCAYALYLSAQYNRAEMIYAELADEFPSDATVLLGYGWTLLKQGKRAAAGAQFKRVQLMFPDNSYAKEGLKWAQP